eukprot:scaffold199137_cov32-Tisochrysis_lutea.AAC.5
MAHQRAEHAFCRAQSEEEMPRPPVSAAWPPTRASIRGSSGQASSADIRAQQTDSEQSHSLNRATR